MISAHSVQFPVFDRPDSFSINALVYALDCASIWAQVGSGSIDSGLMLDDLD